MERDTYQHTRESQLTLNQGVVHKLEEWRAFRELTHEEMVYLNLAKLTIARILSQDDRDTAAHAR